MLHIQFDCIYKTDFSVSMHSYHKLCVTGLSAWRASAVKERFHLYLECSNPIFIDCLSISLCNQLITSCFCSTEIWGCGHWKKKQTCFCLSIASASIYDSKDITTTANSPWDLGICLTKSRVCTSSNKMHCLMDIKYYLRLGMELKVHLHILVNSSLRHLPQVSSLLQGFLHNCNILSCHWVARFDIQNNRTRRKIFCFY